MAEQITPGQFLEADGVEDWRVVGDGMCAFFRAASMAGGARFAAAIAELPGMERPQQGIDVRLDGVTVRLISISDEYFGPTTLDVELARGISTKAREMGLVSDPSGVQSLLVIPGAKGIEKVMPFWRAVLGYIPRPDSPNEDLIDPRGRGAPFWFEDMDELRADGKGSIHLAVWMSHDEARDRIAAAMAAGGRMVRDEYAPAWWTLADPAGNEVDISTVKGRGG